VILDVVDQSGHRIVGGVYDTTYDSMPNKEGWGDALRFLMVPYGH
jgi:hypothetical protein